MSKLNKPGVNVTTNIRVVAAKRGQDLGYSANGNLQFKKPDLQMLYELVVTTMFGKQNMSNSADALVKRVKEGVRKAVDQGEFDFIANLAIHARTEMNIRTIPVVVVVEFAKAIADLRAPHLERVKAADQKLRKLTTAKKGGIAGARAELAQAKEKADGFAYANMRNLVSDVIQRADQITDLYAYALEVFGSKDKIPMAIKRGVADAFNKFGEYHFAKWG